MKPKVSIIVLNWNGRQLTMNCVKSILKNTSYPNFNVIIVDNGSTDGSVKALQKLKNITILSLKENYGFSKGMNTGAWHALRSYSPDYLAFVNNDMEFTQKNWLSTLIQELEKDPRAAVATPRFKKGDGTLIYAGANYGTHLRATISYRIPVQDPNRKQYVTNNYAALALIKNETLKKIGLWDERFSPFWHEDHDLDRRVLKAGYKIIYVPDVTLYHGVSKTLSTIEQKEGRHAIRAIERKNCVRYAHKHFSLPYFLLVFLYKFAQAFIDRKGIHSPIWTFRLLSELDFKKEKVWISDNEASSRIQDTVIT